MNIGVSRKEGITNKFSSGVVALVVIAGRPKTCSSSDQVYEFYPASTTIWLQMLKSDLN